MFSDFLTRVLTDSQRDTYNPGCGMSTRPGYYSGRGATTSDLKGEHLALIHAAIVKNVSKEAGEAFVSMVDDIPVLSATDFLITLSALERNGFVWSKKLLGNQSGVHAENEGEAMGTILSAFGGPRGDATETIRGEFFWKLGRKSNRRPKIHQDSHGNLYYTDPYGYYNRDS